uniref:Murine leukemia virus integrase C-terminal domain-containing protein n=1 Tax=Chrysemys picta bellii TaxID=8478 RepID=A0A8C3FR73_CHRPI
MTLIRCIRSLHKQVQSALPEPADTPCHPLQPGDWVYIKVHQRKTALEPRWKGPYQILLTTHTAIKCKGLANWVHASHCKQISPPLDPDAEEFHPANPVLGNNLDSDCNPSPGSDKEPRYNLRKRQWVNLSPA